MVTVRSLGGIALLLAGSTWLWLTPSFATRGVSTLRRCADSSAAKVPESRNSWTTGKGR